MTGTIQQPQEQTHEIRLTVMCHVCGASLSAPVYQSAGEQSITSLCVLRQGRTEVYWCADCGHLSTPALDGQAEYYDNDYRMMVDAEEEDQLIELPNGKTIFRCDHQVSTLLDRVSLAEGARVLDYGCGKASTLKRLLAARPDLTGCAFDVTRGYESFWRLFLQPGEFAAYKPLEGWHGSFDLLMSYFALEHTPNPIAFCQQVWDLLSSGGVFYGVVPDTYQNIADFVVLDHTNHFSKRSLEHLLRETGFEPVSIEARAHPGAWVFCARKLMAIPKLFCAVESETIDVEKEADQVAAMAEYWRSFSLCVRAFEENSPATEVAIYGSGFYGSYILSALKHPERVTCFVDRNPHRQGKELFGKPVVSPAQLPEGITTVYTGVNPAIARDAIAGVEDWRGRSLSVWYP